MEVGEQVLAVGPADHRDVLRHRETHVDHVRLRRVLEQEDDGVESVVLFLLLRRSIAHLRLRAGVWLVCMMRNCGQSWPDRAFVKFLS